MIEIPPGCTGTLEIFHHGRYCPIHNVTYVTDPPETALSKPRDVEEHNLPGLFDSVRAARQFRDQDDDFIEGMATLICNLYGLSSYHLDYVIAEIKREDTC